ncbi:MAG: methyltransferase domain-containing protein [Acidimicrobiales bacterium]
MDVELLRLLCCPRDRTAPLRVAEDSLICPTCDATFPIVDGIVVFLDAQQLSEEEEREKEFRSAESEEYDDLYAGYTDAVEVPSVMRRLGRPVGPMLDAGCGTGRITRAMGALGQPIVAIDYSDACLRRMIRRCEGIRVLPVQSDLRSIPVRSGAMSAVTCMEVHQHVRDTDRPRFLAELARVLAPDAPLVISTFNYNLIFRAWRLLGNEGARRGEHVLGNDYPYRRFERDEFARELSAVLEVRELTGIRNIPARSIAQAIRRLGARRAGDRFQHYMTERGLRADHFLEHTAVARAVGFFWLARAVKRGDPTSAAA